jgi:heterodisulfide reductase subunit B2
MNYAYYPGCSLTGSAKKLDKGVRRICDKLGHSLTEIPDWNCCGALEYGDRNELMAISGENLKKARTKKILAPCPACYKNLKEAAMEERKGSEFRVPSYSSDPTPNTQHPTPSSSPTALSTQHSTLSSVVHPLELLTPDALAAIEVKRDLKGRVFTAYYGCLLLRPEGTAIRNKNVIEELIASFGGELEGEKVRDRCCGGNQLFVNKWATEKLSKLIIDKSKGTIVVFCPFCHMAMKTFSGSRKVAYVTDLLLYVMGEGNAL